jgi:hypothetical protein
MLGHRRSLGLAGLVIAGLMVLGTACSSSSKNSSTTTTVSIAAQCANLKSLATSMTEKGTSAQNAGSALSAGDTAALTTAQHDFSSLVSDLQSAAASAPAAIQTDVQMLADSFSAFATALNQVNASNISDPTVQAQLNAAATSLSNNSTAIQQAASNIADWASQNCSSTN